MLKKTGYLLLAIIVVITLIYFFNWEVDNKLQSRGNPHTKVSEDITKENEADFSRTLAINKMIEQMSIDEKVGQLLFAGITGTTVTEETKILINEYKVGGIILFANNLDNPEQSIQLLNQIKIENEEKILPLFLGVDQEGGRVERLPDLIKLPTNQEIGTKNNEQLSYEIGELLGKQLHAFGFNLNFAPVLDVNSNPNNPVIGDRSFGDNPEVVSKLGVQSMQGMQSQHIISVIKHFPGHGDTDVDSHVKLPLVDKSLEKLKTLELVPFEKAIEAGADVIMTAHILLPQIDDTFPASMSEKVITGMLREELEFDGIVITDDMTMQAITAHFDIDEAAVESVKAGTDIILMAHGYDELVSVFNRLKEAVLSGEITEERINKSLQRIVRLKWKYGIEDQRVNTIDIEGLNELMEEMLHE